MERKKIKQTAMDSKGRRWFLPMSTSELPEQLEETIPIEFFKLSLIDEIIGSFFATRPVATLLKNAEKYTVDQGVNVLYKFKETTYSGCLRARTHEDEKGERSYVLVVHMSHDGICYTRRQQKEVAAVHSHWHKRGCWESLTKDFLETQKMTNMIAQMKAAGAAKVDFRYNFPHKRIDILFFQSDNHHFMTLCFEHDTSEGTAKAEYAVELE